MTYISSLTWGLSLLRFLVLMLAVSEGFFLAYPLLKSGLRKLQLGSKQDSALISKPAGMPQDEFEKFLEGWAKKI